jgi:ADP-ribosyl-[dinitrogen reductase] hydrolase
MNLSRALEVAIETARLAGDLLRADFHRPGGPRGGGDKAEADTEAERLIRARLIAAFPGWGYLGEETGGVPGEPGQPVWLVDPNDGTRDYVVGRRGSAVSLGLAYEGRPVLGVVYAFSYPDDAGDLFAWAEGCGPLTRNGRPVETRLPATLSALDTVLVSSKGDRDPLGNTTCAAPARYRCVVSIAHRLALVASGEAAVATSLFGPRDWDYAGGHALLRAAGAILVNEQGREISYGADGTSRTELAFGGHPDVVELLWRRPWRSVVTARWGAEKPVALQRGATVPDPGLLSRAQGCLLGQIAGDSLGGLVEFQSEEAIRARYPDGPRQLGDGGTWHLIAGQATDDSEMALALARAVVREGRYDAAAVKDAYVAWLESGPFDVGTTTRRGLTGHPDPDSQANGSLMRASPLALLGYRRPIAELVEVGRRDSALTHPHPACGDAVAAFLVAAAHGLRHGDGPRPAYDAAVAWAREAGAAPSIQEALRDAQGEPPRCDQGSIGWVALALQNAFHELLHARSLEEGVVATVRRGGDTDTNAAITGALLGAVHGREAIPAQWRLLVLSCHPHPQSARPRPMSCWPSDVYEIAERLLLCG